MILIRSALFNAAFYVSFLIVSILGLPFLATRQGVFRVARVWARTNLWLMEHIAGIRFEVRGLKYLPKGGCIIAAKHQSAMETFGIVPFVGDFAFILKRELNWLPLFGWYTSRSGMIGVNRGARSAALRDMTAEARKAVADGRQIIIYPEGTRRPAGAEPAYKYGAVHLYTQLGVPCVPVALNTGLFWPRRAFLRYPGTAVMEFLPPIKPGLDSESFKTLLQDTIEEASNRLIAEARARGEGIPANRIKPPKK